MHDEELYSAHAAYNGTSKTGLLYFFSALASMCSHINPVLYDPNKTRLVVVIFRCKGGIWSCELFSSFCVSVNLLAKLEETGSSKYSEDVVVLVARGM